MSWTPPSQSLTQRQISHEYFGYVDPEWFSKHKAELIRKGFPPPLPGPGRKRWSKKQVTRWFDTGGKSYEPANDNDEATTTAWQNKLNKKQQHESQEG